MRSRIPIDASGRERIEAAVRAAERTTDGELVVNVARACDEYGSAGWRCGVLLAALVSLGVGFFDPILPLSAFLGIQAAALLLGHAAARWEPVRRRFVSEAFLEAAAQRRAASAFAEYGLRFTANRTGILILVALFEHRVVVLADEGVNAQLEPGESWQEVVDLVLGGIRSGDLVDGIVRAVGRCGEILAHSLPAEVPRRDEIREALVIEA